MMNRDELRALVLPGADRIEEVLSAIEARRPELGDAARCYALGMMAINQMVAYPDEAAELRRLPMMMFMQLARQCGITKEESRALASAYQRDTDEAAS